MATATAVAFVERVDGCSSTFDSGYDVVVLDQVALDESGGHRRLVKVMNDVSLLFFEARLLLAHVDLSLTLAYGGLIQLVLEVYSVSWMDLRAGSLGRAIRESTHVIFLSLYVLVLIAHVSGIVLIVSHIFEFQNIFKLKCKFNL